jgi:hypothetical protein
MSEQQRATIVVKVGGREVARQQVRVSDGDTVELEVPVRAVTDSVSAELARQVRDTAQFRVTSVEEKKKKRETS